LFRSFALLIDLKLVSMLANLLHYYKLQMIDDIQ
jgi:hypothetical protein